MSRKNFDELKNNYLVDLVDIVKEEASQGVNRYKDEKSSVGINCETDFAYEEGYAAGYSRVILIMIDLGFVYNKSLSNLNLNDINPDEDLVPNNYFKIEKINNEHLKSSLGKEYLLDLIFTVKHEALISTEMYNKQAKCSTSNSFDLEYIKGYAYALTRVVSNMMFVTLAYPSLIHELDLDDIDTDKNMMPGGFGRLDQYE